MTQDQKLIRNKLGLLKLAQTLGSARSIGQPRATGNSGTPPRSSSIKKRGNCRADGWRPEAAIPRGLSHHPKTIDKDERQD